MASPQASARPTINTAWEAVLAHVPTILMVWIASAVISGIGLGLFVLIVVVGTGAGASSDGASTLLATLGNVVQLPFAVLSGLVGVLAVAVPALHYETGEVITVERAFAALLQRPWRYLLAGALFSLATTIGTLLCLLPGIAVALVMPVYVNRIFLTDQPILEVFAASFQAVYGSENGRMFAVLEILVGLLVAVASLCTCGLAALVAVPMSYFYLQNAAYHRGVIR
ncbi:MAG: hypothetical protein VKO65_03945 [Cyanobacteriota bacterium]|nr:hypothetical protein [Cyanobacteriota bacterium]